MTIARQTIAGALVTVLVIVVCGLSVWRPLVRQWAIRKSTDYFREEFQPKKDLYVCIHEDSWAWFHFGGTRGLATLEELSQDRSLAPCGRSLASNLVRRISSGQHLQSFDEMNRGMSWLAKKYLAYIREQDMTFLRKMSPSPSAGDAATRAAPEK